MSGFETFHLENPPGMTSEDLRKHKDNMLRDAENLNPHKDQKVHDYTRQGWGHTLGSFKWDQVEPGVFKVDGFGLGVQTKDLVRLGMQSGKVARFEVLEIRYESNPKDMFWATIGFIGYEDE
jgi:hypothetical protein